MPATFEVKPALRKFVDAEADAALIDLIEKRFNEAEAKDEQRAADIKLYLEKRFGEVEKRFGELEVKSAERQASQMKWMITFFVGLLFTLAGLMFAYLQLLGKP